MWHAPRMNEQQLVVDPRAFYRLTYEVGNRYAMYSEQEYMELLRKAIELELRYKQEKAGQTVDEAGIRARALGILDSYKWKAEHADEELGA